MTLPDVGGGVSNEGDWGDGEVVVRLPGFSTGRLRKNSICWESILSVFLTGLFHFMTHFMTHKIVRIRLANKIWNDNVECRFIGEKPELLTNLGLIRERKKHNNQTNGEKTNDINENTEHRYLQMKMWNQSLNDV